MTNLFKVAHVTQGKILFSTERNKAFFIDGRLSFNAQAPRSYLLIYSAKFKRTVIR